MSTPVQVTNATHKTVTSVCPTSSGVLGAGAQITPHTGPATFVSITPFEYQGDHMVTVTAGEHPSGVSRNWGPRAYAICSII